MCGTFFWTVSGFAVVFGDTVEISETSRFVMLVSSTRRCIIRRIKSERDINEKCQHGSSLSSLSILLSSSSALHTVEGLFSVSMGNDFDEERFGTITFEFHEEEEELDTDRFRTVADKFEDDEDLLCDFAGFVLVVTSQRMHRLLTFCTVCNSALCYESVCSDILRHVDSTTKIRCVLRTCSSFLFCRLLFCLLRQGRLSSHFCSVRFRCQLP